MHEPPLPVKASFQEQAVQMGIEPDKASGRSVGDHRRALDLPAGGRGLESWIKPWASRLTSPYSLRFMRKNICNTFGLPPRKRGCRPRET